MPDWKPQASLSHLRYRATVVDKIREFFKARNVLEVETPLLCHTSNPDPHIHSIQAGALYLQTSPEFAMKRLLAADSGAIFQICKAFREEESGRLHNPEFTMLEWYRPGFTHHDLMSEMDEFLQFVLNTNPAKRLSYQALFISYLNLDPFAVNVADLLDYAKTQGLSLSEILTNTDQDTLLQLLLTHLIEPQLGQNNTPTFIYDFPPSQAALAKVREGNPRVGERFEVYLNGIELANGFHELTNSEEQRQRFVENNQARARQERPLIPLDERFLSALDSHPPASGVALGVDRLVMLALNADHISQVLAFPIDLA